MRKKYYILLCIITLLSSSVLGNISLAIAKNTQERKQAKEINILAKNLLKSILREFPRNTFQNARVFLRPVYPLEETVKQRIFDEQFFTFLQEAFIVNKIHISSYADKKDLIEQDSILAEQNIQFNAINNANQRKKIILLQEKLNETRKEELAVIKKYNEAKKREKKVKIELNSLDKSIIELQINHKKYIEHEAKLEEDLVKKEIDRKKLEDDLIDATDAELIVVENLKELKKELSDSVLAIGLLSTEDEKKDYTLLTTQREINIKKEEANVIIKKEAIIIIENEIKRIDLETKEAKKNIEIIREEIIKIDVNIDNDTLKVAELKTELINLNTILLENKKIFIVKKDGIEELSEKIKKIAPANKIPIKEILEIEIKYIYTANMLSIIAEVKSLQKMRVLKKVMHKSSITPHIAKLLQEESIHLEDIKVRSVSPAGIADINVARKDEAIYEKGIH